MHHGRADAAADADGPAGIDELGRAAQGARNVLDGITDLQHAQVAAGLAHGLDDERDGARHGVRVGDGQRDPLGTLGAADDDELAGLPDLRDAAGLDDEARDIGRQDVALDDWMHRSVQLPLVSGRPFDPCEQAASSLRR